MVDRSKVLLNFGQMTLWTFENTILAFSPLTSESKMKSIA